MRNTVWYIALCVTSTILFAYTLWKKKDNKLWVLYFFAAGLTYFLEYFALVIFDSYNYHPHILKNEYFDNVLGSMVSNAFTIPMTCTFVAGLKLSFVKRLFLAAGVLVIEITFVRLGIYEQHWWRHFYTFAGAIIAYIFSQKWLVMIQGRINTVLRYINLFFANLLVQASIVFVVSGILELYIYKVHWFENPYRSHVAFATLYIMIMTAAFVSLVVFRSKWYWITAVVLLPSIIDIVLLKADILQMSEKWSLLNFLILRILVLIIIYLFNKHLLSETHDYKVNA